MIVFLNITIFLIGSLFFLSLLTDERFERFSWRLLISLSILALFFWCVTSSVPFMPTTGR